MDLPIEASGAVVGQGREAVMEWPERSASEGGDEAQVSSWARARRARRIGATFGRVYLELQTNRWLARGLGKTRLGKAQMEARWGRFHQRSAQLLYETAVDLRGLVLKGCQLLGSRPDLLPPEWIAVLSRLQDRVPPKPFELVRHIVERELGRRLELVFRSFSPEPVAAASLAQVHEAVLRNGQRVAVKVQYPEIEALVQSDLANLTMLFRSVAGLERDFDPLPLVEELGAHVTRELDFLAEARNAERLRRMLGGRHDVRVPQIHRALCTRRLLVMEFVEGIKITNTDALARAGIERGQVVETLVEVFAEQVLEHGFFHADPHPGNLQVDPDGPCLVWLDFGLAKELPPRFRQDVGVLLAAGLAADATQVVKALVSLGFETRDGSSDSLLRVAELLLEALHQALRSGPLGSAEVMRVGRRVAEVLRANPIVRVPSHLVLLARAAGLISGVARSLNVRVDLLRLVQSQRGGDRGAPGPLAA